LMLAKRGELRRRLRKLARRASEPVMVVCILTGHGLKDPERAIATCRAPRSLRPDLAHIAKAVGLR